MPERTVDESPPTASSTSGPAGSPLRPTGAAAAVQRRPFHAHVLHCISPMAACARALHSLTRACARLAASPGDGRQPTHAPQPCRPTHFWVAAISLAAAALSVRPRERCLCAPLSPTGTPTGTATTAGDADELRADADGAGGIGGALRHRAPL